MKTLSIVLFSLFVLSPASFAKPALFGGNSGGGGDLTPPRKITEAELTQFLQQHVVKLTGWYFNNLLSPILNMEAYNDENGEYVVSGKEKGRTFSHKLTNPSLDIFTAIKTAKIVVQNKPCIDPKTLAKRDASANPETMTICFNARGMWRKNNTSSVFNHALGLAIHEFSHLCGTDEPEAQELERLAIVAIKVHNHALLDLDDEWKDTLKWSTESDHAEPLKMLIEDVDKLSDVGLAFAIVNLDKGLSEDIQTAGIQQTTLGLGPLTIEDHSKMLGLIFRLMNLKLFLNSVPSAFEFRGIERPLSAVTLDSNRPDPMQLQILAKTFFGDHLKVPVFTGEVYDTSTGSRAAVRKELEEILKTFKQIFPN